MNRSRNPRVPNEDAIFIPKKVTGHEIRTRRSKRVNPFVTTERSRKYDDMIESRHLSTPTGVNLIQFTPHGDVQNSETSGRHSCHTHTSGSRTPFLTDFCIRDGSYMDEQFKFLFGVQHSPITVIPHAKKPCVLPIIKQHQRRNTPQNMLTVGSRIDHICENIILPDDTKSRSNKILTWIPNGSVAKVSRSDLLPEFPTQTSPLLSARRIYICIPRESTLILEPIKNLKCRSTLQKVHLHEKSMLSSELMLSCLAFMEITVRNISDQYEFIQDIIDTSSCVNAQTARIVCQSIRSNDYSPKSIDGMTFLTGISITTIQSHRWFKTRQNKSSPGWIEITKHGTVYNDQFEKEVKNVSVPKQDPRIVEKCIPTIQTRGYYQRHVHPTEVQVLNNTIIVSSRKAYIGITPSSCHALKSRDKISGPIAIITDHSYKVVTKSLPDAKPEVIKRRTPERLTVEHLVKYSPQPPRANRKKRARQVSHPGLIASKFHKVPPVIRFVEEGSKVTAATEDLETVESADWIFYYGKHMRPQIFRTIAEHQKVNHLPCSFQLGRKDRLWLNIAYMQTHVNKSDFNFMPETFCIPTHLEELKKAWDSDMATNQRWILKPPACARGIGVRIITKWSQVPKTRPFIVQRYLANPYLINDSKFDLRIYVYIAHISPLRIYIHRDGLVRFASQKYTNEATSLNNRFIHLTNYSINRLNSEYKSNSSENSAKGHKWSLKVLWTYFKSKGISPKIVWANIKDVVAKTIISCESALYTALHNYCDHPSTVHELFGFDIFLDDQLKPWLLEVNVSPSMHSDSPLDSKIKGVMITDMLNIAGLNLPEADDILSSRTISKVKLIRSRSSVSSGDVGSENGHQSPVKLSFDGFCQSPGPTANKLDGGSSTPDLDSKLDAKPLPPSHDWLLDSRLNNRKAGYNERLKIRHYLQLAYDVGLFRQPTTIKSSSSTKTRQSDSGRRSRMNVLANRRPIRPCHSTSSSPSSSSASSDCDDDDGGGGEDEIGIDQLGARSLGIGPSSAEASSISYLPKNVTSPAKNTPINNMAVVSGTSKTSHYSPAANQSPSRQASVLLTRRRSSVAAVTSSTSPSLDRLRIPPQQVPTTSTDPVDLLSRLDRALDKILERLTPLDLRILTQLVDELDRVGGFECIFPPQSAATCVRYLTYFDKPHYENLLCIAFLQKYGQDTQKGIDQINRACAKGIHLLSAAYGDDIPREHIWHRQ